MTLSFDRATESSNAMPCGQCGQRIDKRYWTWQGRAFCETCKASLARTLEKANSKKAFASAALRGGAVAVGCGVAYALFVHFTHFQLSIITIGIGIVVAKVVRAASLNVGGRRYQVLAVALTYFASTMAYAPALVSAFRGAMNPESAQSAAPSSVSRSQGSEEEGAATTTSAAADEPRPEPTLTRGQLALALGALLFGFLRIMLMAPFLELTEAPLGLLIVGFGLWQAWKLTRGLSMEAEGPFSLSSTTSSS